MNRNNRQIIIFTVIATVVVAVSVFIALRVKYVYKPKITVNYLAQYNELNKPRSYDINDNAAPYFEKAFECMIKAPESVAKNYKCWPADINDQDIAALRNWVASNSEALDYLRAGIAKPYYWIPRKAKNNEVMKMETSDFGCLRQAVYLLCTDAKLMVIEGQIDEGLGQLIDVYKMGTFFTGRVDLIEQLVGIAISAHAVQTSFQVLNNTPLTAEELLDFGGKLQSIYRSRPVVVDFTAEELLFYDQVQRVFTDNGDGTGHVYGYRFLENPLRNIRILLLSRDSNGIEQKWAATDRRHTIELADKMYGYFQKAAHQTPWDLHTQNIDFQAYVAEITENHYLLNILAPTFAKSLRISYRLQAHTKGLLTTISILRYKLDKGHLPSDINDLLQQGYLDELPIDPFSGSPLVYKLSGDNFILYSFAEDLDDDGGKHDPKWADKGDGDFVFWPVQHLEKGK